MRIGKRELTMAITAAAMTLALGRLHGRKQRFCWHHQSHGGRCLHRRPWCRERCRRFG